MCDVFHRTDDPVVKIPNCRAGFPTPRSLPRDRRQGNKTPKNESQNQRRRATFQTHIGRAKGDNQKTDPPDGQDQQNQGQQAQPRGADKAAAQGEGLIREEVGEDAEGLLEEGPEDKSS